MLSTKLGHSLDPILLGFVRLTFKEKRKISPNAVTILGAVAGLVASFCIAWESFFLAALVLGISGFCDLLDGALARERGEVTRFGGFLDSVLDRYTDLFIMCGIFVYFIRMGSEFYATATFIAAIGVALVPYARARAEAASIDCRVGFLERPERLVLILIGLLFPVLPHVIVVLAVLTHATTVQRILHVKKAARQKENQRAD